MRVAVVLLLLSWSRTVVADSWADPVPKMWASADSQTVIEVFPRESQHNPSKDPLAYVYKVSQNDAHKITSRLLWKGALVDVPVDAVITRTGGVVTLDRWGSTGYAHSIVVYSPAGKLLKTHHLDSLLPAWVADQNRSVSSRDWRKFATYHLDATTFYIKLHAGVIAVSLATGAAKLLDKEPKALLRADKVNVTSTDLKFASLTDLARVCKP